MKIVVFGAGGRTGSLLLKQATEGGHSLTAFVRNPAKLAIQAPAIRIIQGDLVQRAAVENAVKDQDAALCAVGGSSLLRRDPAFTVGVHNIILAMEQAGVLRLIYLSNDAVPEVRPELNLFRRYVIASLLLRNPAADHDLNERMIRQSRLDWTIVRPPYLTNGERTGRYRTGEHIAKAPSVPRISRADLAEFMLNELSESQYVRKAAILMY
jgi:putative NADH-flavin reductase